MTAIRNKLIISIALMTSVACAAPAWAATLTWDPNTDPVDGYRIYYGTDDTTPAQMVDVADATAYDIGDLPLSENIQYYFWVCAYNAAGESPKAGPVAYTPTDNTPPNPPVGFEVVPPN